MRQKLINNPKFSENLRKLRYKSGLSQEKLCVQLQKRACDIGRSTYAKYETNRLNVRIEVLVALKDIYNCAFDDFFEGIGSEISNQHFLKDD